VDVRIICAANKDLRELVARGEFREDLYYRLNFVVLSIPPLRERKEDIPLLARHFLEEAAARSERDLRGFTPEALSLMMRHHWPGNVRELQSEIAHAVTMAEGHYVGLRDFKSRGFRGELAVDAAEAVGDSRESMNLDRAIEQLTRHLMVNALETTDGHVTRAAQLIGVSRGRFYDLAKKYGVELGGKQGR
jgi:DNA-binding NtrC family response regulator